MYRIRRFGVIRTATVVAVAYAIIFAIIVLPFLLLVSRWAPAGPAALGELLYGALALVVIYPLLIWVFTALACLIYNLAARWVGGIEVQVERVQPPGYPYGGQYPPPGYPPPGWAGPRQPGQAGQPSPPPPWGQPPTGQPPWGQPPTGQPPTGQPPTTRPGDQPPERS